MLKLISGTLVGGVKFSDLYIVSNEDEDISSTSASVNESDKDHGNKKTQRKTPTLPQIARKWQGFRRHNWMKNNILHMR